MEGEQVWTELKAMMKRRSEMIAVIIDEYTESRYLLTSILQSLGPLPTGEKVEDDGADDTSQRLLSEILTGKTGVEKNRTMPREISVHDKFIPSRTSHILCCCCGDGVSASGTKLRVCGSMR